MNGRGQDPGGSQDPRTDENASSPGESSAEAMGVFYEVIVPVLATADMVRAEMKRRDYPQDISDATAAHLINQAIAFSFTPQQQPCGH